MAENYHHGDLKKLVLSIAAETVAEAGPDAVSLRGIARRAGVSHAAPAHHFGDRRGLFTVLAIEGFRRLAAAMRPTIEAEDFAETAVAYVHFAHRERGYFAVMFRRDLLDNTDSTLQSARAETSELLSSGLATVTEEAIVVDAKAARTSAWALVHGLANLTFSGALDGEDLTALTRACAQQLFPD